MECWWNANDREKLKYLNKKPAPVPLCLPGIPHGLKWRSILVIFCYVFNRWQSVTVIWKRSGCFNDRYISLFGWLQWQAHFSWIFWLTKESCLVILQCTVWLRLVDQVSRLGSKTSVTDSLYPCYQTICRVLVRPTQVLWHCTRDLSHPPLHFTLTRFPLLEHSPQVATSWAHCKGRISNEICNTELNGSWHRGRLRLRWKQQVMKDVMQKGGRQVGGMGRERDSWRLFTGQYIQSTKKVGGKRDRRKRRMRRSKGR